MEHSHSTDEGGGEEEEESGGGNENEDQQQQITAPAAATAFACTTCGIRFSRRANRDRHIRLVHNNISRVFDCTFCGAFFDSIEKLRQHRESHEPSTGFVKRDSAFRKSCIIYQKTYGKKMLTLEDAFMEDKKDMTNLLSFQLAERKSAKVGIIYHVEFARLQVQGQSETAGADGNEAAGDEGGGGEEEENSQDISLATDAEERIYEVCLRAPSSLVTMASNFQNVIFAAQQNIELRAVDFVENGSGWRLNCVLRADIEIGSCPALNGSCGLVSIDFHKSLDRVKKSKDVQRCFLHACAFHFVRSQNLAKLNRYIKKNFVVKIASPVKVVDIPRFERHNSHLKLKINVIFAEDDAEGKKKIYPLIFSKRVDAKHHITLILYKTEAEGKILNHYAYVTNVDKFLRCCYKRGHNYSYEKSITCLNCFTKFSIRSKTKMKQHYALCLKNEPQAIKVPQEGSTVHFKNYVNKFSAHFVGFFDFESCHRKQMYECDKCCKVKEGDETICPHQTLVKAVQEPITYSYLILDRNEKIVFNNTYTGEDCVKKFLEELISIEEDLLAVLNANILINMTPNDETVYQAATNCHICEEELDDDKVRDHCHITGDFLGAAHNTCNLQRVERKTISMFCHNLTGYDGHFLMQQLGSIEGVKKMNALPYNTERFRCIEMNSFRFLDSLSFLNASLSELMENLKRNKLHTFPIIDQLEIYSAEDVKKKELILRKGVYPYEYVTSIQKLEKTLGIPEKKHFFSSLTNSGISEEDYLHSKKVFQDFHCSNMVSCTHTHTHTHTHARFFLKNIFSSL